MIGNILKRLKSNDYRTLRLISDNADWALDYETKKLFEITQSLGINSTLSGEFNPDTKECIHYSSQFILADDKFFLPNKRISTDYYHGLPHQGEEFVKLFDGLIRNKEKITRIRVSQKIVEDAVLQTGIDPLKVHRIPIGIDDELFRKSTMNEKLIMRKRLRIPEEAFVVGSFQKDGNGWGEGLEPKLIKGPDIFLQAISILKHEIPNLFVLLTGPARGYVKKGLSELKVPFYHEFLKNPEDVHEFYRALDVYIISSREEGGPKSVLESQATGVFLVTTKVGQAVDLVKHNYNGFMVEQEDSKGLAENTLKVFFEKSKLNYILDNGQKTSAENSYKAQLPFWKSFFEGYVNF